MKVKRYRIYTIFYLAIMVCYLVRPVIPYIEYTLNKDYIAKYLCVKKDIPGNNCQGQCHLHKQLRVNAENNGTDQDDNKNNNPNNKVDDHMQANCILPQPERPEINLAFNNCFAVIVSFPDPVFTPPKQ